MKSVVELTEIRSRCPDTYFYVYNWEACQYRFRQSVSFLAKCLTPCECFINLKKGPTPLEGEPYQVKTFRSSRLFS